MVIVKDPYTDSRTGPELVLGPEKLEKAAAIGIASTPYGPRDPEHKSRQAAIRLIEGAVKGVKKRK